MSENTGKSIIGDKYKDGFKTKGDWISKFIEKNAFVEGTPAEKNDEGKVTAKAVKGYYDVNKIMELGKVNGVDVSKYGEVDQTKAGRMRMTIGNILRAAAKRRHGLNDLGGNFRKASPEFLQSSEAPEKPTEKPDGTKIDRPKAKAEDKKVA